ncbi:MAG: GNAT family N-acetyltransferase [Firmicutes bacterium]|nr:GNAT family N-acetyltransferase [Bacillota bacterium]
MPEITVGPAREQDYEELMALLDDVFFLEDEETPKRCFLTLLPKLYKREYRPWEKNYCVWEDGALKAAVGMYVSDAEIAGQALRAGGIGNVAVARDSRRKGYMRLAMDAAMEAMRAAGCDFGELGGQRQRYQFWGFERGGAAVDASFSEKNLRHAYGENALDADWRAEEMKPDDQESLTKVQAFIEDMPIHYKHGPAAFYDCLCSWNETPYAIWKEESLEGFFTLSRDKKYIGQLRLAGAGNPEMAIRAVYSVLPERGGGKRVGMTIPLWQTDLLRLAEEISEGCDIDDTGMYTILRWEKMLGALMKLQAQCKPLPDGDISIRVDGEALRVIVKDGVASVAGGKNAAPTDRVFTHLEAMRYFLAPYSILREGDALAQCWFPLPLGLMGIDTV